MRKHKEFFKTALLTLLIVSAVTIASQIWFSEELWSNDYSSFSITRESDSIFSRIIGIFRPAPKSAALDYSQIFYPKVILLSSGGNRMLLSKNTDTYDFFEMQFKALLQNVFTDAKFDEITEEDLRKAYRAPSVYIDFYNPISFTMLGDYYGVDLSAGVLELDQVKHILLALSQSGDYVSLYLKTNDTKKCLKISFKGDLTAMNSRVDEILNKTSSPERPYFIAFEQGFDFMSGAVEGVEVQVPDRLPLDSYAFVNLLNITLFEITPVTLLDSADSFDLNPDIQDLFGVNTGSFRRYWDSGGAINYVENHATVKIYPDGLLEYNAVDASKGISLATDSNSNFNMLKTAGEFMKSVHSVLPAHPANEYIFHSIVKEEDYKNRYVIHFDLLYDGIPVVLGRKASDGNPLNHAISVTVDDGRIVSYKDYLVQYQKDSQTVSNADFIMALDEFYGIYDILSGREVTINDIYSIYYNNTDDKEVSPKWAVSLSNGELVIVSPRH